MNAERLCNAAEAAIGFLENLKDRSGNKLACGSMIKELRLAIRQAKKPEPTGVPIEKIQDLYNKAQAMPQTRASSLLLSEIITILDEHRKAQPTRVVAFLDGGLIQEIYADREIEFLKIDMDVEDAEYDEVTLYPDANGNENSACISLEETKNYPHSIAAVDKRYVETLFNKLNHLRKESGNENANRN